MYELTPRRSLYKLKWSSIQYKFAFFAHHVLAAFLIVLVRPNVQQLENVEYLDIQYQHLNLEYKCLSFEAQAIVGEIEKEHQDISFLLK